MLIAFFSDVPSPAMACALMRLNSKKNKTSDPKKAKKLSKSAQKLRYWKKKLLMKWLKSAQKSAQDLAKSEESGESLRENCENLCRNAENTTLHRALVEKSPKEHLDDLTIDETKSGINYYTFLSRHYYLDRILNLLFGPPSYIT